MKFINDPTDYRWVNVDGLEFEPDPTRNPTVKKLEGGAWEVTIPARIVRRYTLAEVGDLRAEFLEAMQYGSAGETDWQNFTRWMEKRTEQAKQFEQLKRAMELRT